MNKNPLTTLIVDDEPDGISTLRNFLAKYCPGVTVLGEASSVDDAITKINTLHPQLVFLDINMPGASGFEVFDTIKDPDFQVVFVTASDDHALQAFKHHAVNYILKPVNIDELVDTVNRVRKLVAAEAAGTDSGPFSQPVARTTLPNKITLPVLDGLVYVEIDQIIRCEAEGNYTIFHFANRPKMLVSRTLGSYEKLLLPHGFFRIHHHHLINLAHLEKYQRGRGGLVIMSDKKSIAVSHRKRDEFLKLIDNIQV